MTLDSWYHEKESAWLYHQVAAAEPDARKRTLFLQLAGAAEEILGKAIGGRDRTIPTKSSRLRLWRSLLMM